MRFSPGSQALGRGAGTAALTLLLVTCLHACGGDEERPPVVCTYCPSAAGGADGGQGGRGTGGGSSSFPVITGLFSLADAECSDDDPCSVGECAEIWPDGFLTCRTTREEARTCDGTMDECCDSSDCAHGKCWSSDGFPYFLGSDRPERQNICHAHLCQGHGDCASDQRCVPAGVFGLAVRTCVPANCDTDSDCGEGQRCAPVEHECGWGIVMLACIDLEQGCARSADCGEDEPPYETGETFCDLGTCTEVGAGTVCGD